MKQSLTKVMILITVMLMDILGGAEIDLFVPSFPELQAQFSLSPVWVEALLSINLTGYCLSLFFVGGLADRYGRKPIILLGLIIFIIGSTLCVWALSYEFLLIGRFLQGVGVAAPATLCFLIIADSYPLKKQQFLMGIMNGLVNASIAAAPIVGSYVTLFFHWQGNFVVLLLLGLATCLMTVFFIPAYQLPERKETLSLSGYVPIFQSTPLMLLIVTIVFILVPYWTFIGMSPLLYMEDLGVNLAHFGYYQGSLAMVFAVGSIVCGLMINKFDQKKMLIVSGQICIVSLMLFLLLIILDPHNALLITLVFQPYNIGMIIPVTILYPLCLNFMPQAKGRVSAMIQAARLALTAGALEVAGYFYQGSFRNIGIIVAGFFLIAVITLFYVIKNRALMQLTT